MLPNFIELRLRTQLVTARTAWEEGREDVTGAALDAALSTLDEQRRLDPRTAAVQVFKDLDRLYSEEVEDSVYTQNIDSVNDFSTFWRKNAEEVADDLARAERKRQAEE